MSLPTTDIRKIGVPIIVVATAGAVMYPAVQALIRGEPLGSGVTKIVVGLLAMLLYVGFELVKRASDASGFGTRAERWTVLALLTAAIGINVALIYAVPDSPEAVGMLIICAIGASVVLFGSTERRARPQS